MKRCSKCKQDKPTDEFGKHSQKPDGLRDNCKLCCRKPPRVLDCAHCGTTWEHRRQGNAPRLCPPCVTTMAWCSVCESTKPHSEFHAGGQRNGLSSRCKPCALAYIGTDEMRASRRAYQLQRTYGLTVEQYDQRVAEQGGGCACCGRSLGKKPVVDHDHETGLVRGILCFGCNTGLGKLGDQAEGVHRAETYLWKSRDLLAELAAGRHSVEEMIGASYV